MSSNIPWFTIELIIACLIIKNHEMIDSFFIRQYESTYLSYLYRAVYLLYDYTVLIPGELFGTCVFLSRGEMEMACLFQ